MRDEQSRILGLLAYDTAKLQSKRITGLTVGDHGTTKSGHIGLHDVP